MLASSREPLILPTLAAIDARIDRSDQSWREWAERLTIPPLYAADLRRSALALKLLLFSPTGAIAAAATTSLPERICGDKNYDYRYAWVRDAAYTIKAFLHVGATEEAKAAFSWITATVQRHGELRVMYRLDGALPPSEETVLDMPGYRGSVPVRTGNRALQQLQLSCYGDLLESASLFVRSGHVLDLDTRRLLGELVDRCADLWRNRDSGIWELDQPEHYTISKIGCWVALDRGIELAALGQVDTSHVERWARQRDRIRDWIDANCWSDAKQSYVLHPGTDRLDASLLLGIPFKFARQDRLSLTRAAIQRELCHGPLVYRMSGMEAEEGTFLACAFWLVEALALEGLHDQAVRQMDALLAVCNLNLGLLHEQMSPDGLQMLGNVPQALSHLALIHAGMAIDQGHP